MCACAITILLQHCGGQTSGGASAGSGGTTAGQGASAGQAGQGGTSAGTGQGGASSGCATTLIDSPVNPPCTSDADCNYGRCREVVPGGYRTCLADVTIQTTCSGQPGQDQCGCDGGTCPTGASCVLDDSPTCGTGGSGPNLCETGCTPGACPTGQVCLRDMQPRIGACYTAICRTDQDCGGCSRCAPYWDQPGGDCDPVLKGLRCTCRTDADCKSGLHCGKVYGEQVGFCL